MSKLFSDKNESDSIKVTRDDSNNAKVTADKYTYADGDRSKHVHEQYKHDTHHGNYKEYHGGENSSDRSYNKSSESSDGGSGK